MKSQNIWLIGGSVVLVLLLLFYFMGSGEKRYSWSETYFRKSNNPYGTEFVFKLLDNYFPDYDFHNIRNSVEEALDTSSGSEPATYCFIGRNIYLDSAAINTILKFAERGNDVFISSIGSPYDLLGEIVYDWTGYVEAENDSAILNFTHPQLTADPGFEFRFQVRNTSFPYNWKYVDSQYLEDTSYHFTKLGYFNDDMVNFVRIPHGSGMIYLHSTPLAFSNFYLTREHGRKYVEKVFNHFKPGDIYWDEINKVSGFDWGDYRSGPSLGDSPFQYILSQMSLAWAFYISLALLLLYILFRAKRKQKIIPVMDPNTNTSLEFVQTIGRLYFQQNDNKKLALHKMKYFLSFIRNRYHLSTHEVTDELIGKISMKSQIPQEKVQTIFKQAASIEKKAEVSDTILIFFHESIDHFYKNCK